MSIIERLGLLALQRFDPETAHGLAIKALNSGLASTPGPVASDRLSTTVAGIRLANPIGLAAGFDKNATCLDPLMRAGFGFIEVGAATRRPQPGNPRPRLFRLTQDNAVINRFGFNNDGIEAIAMRLAQKPQGIPVGLNLGVNKDSTDKAGDFAHTLQICGASCDFVTVNVSSPNTEKLRDLQGSKALVALLGSVMDARAELTKPIPVFLKISPDLTEADLAQIATVATMAGVDAIIATNTTLDRSGLRSVHKSESGGLSGAPLFEKSTRILARLSKLTDGAMPLIGVGGVSNADQAYVKIKAGASAVQFYSAMVFNGLSLAEEIPAGLDKLLENDGYTSIEDAVGTERNNWL